MKLTEEQSKLVDDIKSFIKSDDKVMTVSGRAGTGKSTIIKYALRRQRNKKYYIPSNVVGVCVTHQARINLHKHIPNSITYAQAVNMVMDVDPNGEIYFFRRKEMLFSPLKGYKVIVVDECSMFSHDMIDALMQCIDKNAKIIFMGDANQLPPIGVKGDNDSPTFSNYQCYHLHKVMRQDKNNPLTSMLNNIVNMIENNIFDIDYFSNLEDNIVIEQVMLFS